MRNYANAVFEGGGIKTIGLIGAAQVVEEQGYQWHSLVGTSGGAIIAAFLTAGYKAGEVLQFLKETPLKSFLANDNILAKIPIAGQGIRFYLSHGLYTGNRIESWIREKLALKGIRTFGDLNGKELKVITSDISLGRMVVLPDDLPDYGLDPARFDIALAIRMSMSIPFFFEPVLLVYGSEKQFTSCFMDGGMLSNFPVWLFDERKEVRWPTFGFHLISDSYGQPNDTSSSIGILKSIINTLLDAHDNRHMEESTYLRTILIPTLGVKTTEFSISDDKFNALYESGRSAASLFFQSWNYATFVSQYLRKK